jgi:hypothetical protein
MMNRVVAGIDNGQICLNMNGLKQVGAPGTQHDNWVVWGCPFVLPIALGIRSRNRFHEL